MRGKADGFEDKRGMRGERAFEPLPLIEGERRLPLLAYHYWQARRGDRAMPTLADCADAEKGSFATRMILIDLARSDGPSRVRGVGAALRHELPPNGDAKGKGLVDELVARLPALALQRAPVGFEAEFPEPPTSANALRFRGILLPLADDRGAMAHVMGVMSWRRTTNMPVADDVLGALATIAGLPPHIAVPDPWSSRDETLAPPPPPTREQKLAEARTWVALARSAPARCRAHLHSAIVATHDAMADAEDGDVAAAARFVFGVAGSFVPLSDIVRVIARARRVGLSGARLGELLDSDARGVEGFLAAPDRVAREARAMPPPVRRFRLTALDPDMLVRPPRRAEAHRSGEPERRVHG